MSNIVSYDVKDTGRHPGPAVITIYLTQSGMKLMNTLKLIAGYTAKVCVGVYLSHK